MTDDKIITKRPPQGCAGDSPRQDSSNSLAIPNFLNPERGNSGRVEGEGKVENSAESRTSGAPAPDLAAVCRDLLLTPFQFGEAHKSYLEYRAGTRGPGCR